MSKLERNRLINAILFFANQSPCCGKTKLFKLLFLLDTKHYAETGRSVTGYDYQAWEHGPVPTKLMDEWTEFKSDLASVVKIEHESFPNGNVRYTIRANEGAVFDDSNFTPRQLRIMNELIEQHANDTAKQMVDLTHEPGGPWHTIWQSGAGNFMPIPFGLVLPQDPALRDYIIESANLASGRLAESSVSDQR